ncbi:MAG: hydantoinase/oxoprolinase family protein [Anaerolineae bacterium]|nr:hydantoinase/oxoprolinase family protein [Anaerolineae bacterium]MDW8098290.1 hydantoinase/oxoprolinase family protein [Anaerolineae bacterium]
MLGIDTGGTYTDAVIIDLESDRVLASAKALTTHDDLSRGIDTAIAALSGVDLTQIRLVGLSTTLATNALVEGRGGRVGLILIGYDPQLIERWGFQRELVTDQVIFVRGGHDLAGREAAPLDEVAIHNAIERYRGQVDAWAISAYFGVRNPEHEQRARELVHACCDLPVTCAYELTGELNSIRRATTAALNARLIPLIQRLIQAVRSSLMRHHISATLMVVRGDGALLRAEVALEHPVETILSGPAASIVGAHHLTGLDNAIVVDMGGTTTDTAVLVRGRPGIRDDGAQVGGWRTLVRAVDVQTTGLGGDSLIQIAGRQMQIGPERAIPFCMMAALHPHARREIERSLRRNWAREIPCLFALVSPLQDWELTETERQIVSALAEGPLSLDRLIELAPRARLYLSRPNRLEQHGLLRRVSFTPTDALHVEGRYRAWDVAVAQRVAAYLGERMGLSAVQVSQTVREAVIRRLAVAILNRLLSLHGGSVDAYQEPIARRLIESALGDGDLPELDVRFRLRRPIVALGAPAQAYFDQVAAWLHAELILPEYAPVANAIGAASGSVMHTCEMRVIAHYDVTGITGYTLHSPTGLWEFSELEEALAFAREQGRELAIRGARAAGAAMVQVEEESTEECATTALDEKPLYLGTRLRFTGVGRPDWRQAGPSSRLLA